MSPCWRISISEVGRLLKALEENNLAKDTLVILVSDNGGFAKAANMGPLRGAKSITLEGGTRVPLTIRWPGRIDSGKTNDQVCANFDPTCSILNLAKIKTSAKLLDGFDIIDHVAKQKPNFNSTLYLRAVLDGNLKYLRKAEGHTEE
jgi:arylsulfatase A-like enzyme